MARAGMGQNGVSSRTSHDQRAASYAIVGRPVRCRLFHVQNRRKPRRCQGDDGLRLDDVNRRPPRVQARDSHAHSTRSTVVKGSRGRRERFAIANWWRSARISTCRAARERTNNRREWRNETTTDRWIEPIRAAHNLNCHKVSRVFGRHSYLLAVSMHRIFAGIHVEHEPIEISSESRKSQIDGKPQQGV